MRRPSVQLCVAFCVLVLTAPVAWAQSEVGSYACYQGKDLKLNPFVEYEIELQDQFTNETVSVKAKVKFVCYPSAVAALPIVSLNPIMVCYQVTAAKLPAELKVLTITEVLKPTPPPESELPGTQLPLTIQFEVEKAKMLCVPATSGGAPLP